MNWNSQRAGPVPPPRDKYTARVEPIMTRLEKFWQRVTDGMKLNELWKQFQADARFSYRLYSQDIDSTRIAGVPKRKHVFNVARQFFWAMLEKLTPARRVLLLIADSLSQWPRGMAKRRWGREYQSRYPFLGRAADVRAIAAGSR
jgi:hypothetical protein